MSLVVLRADDRFVTRRAGSLSRHCFSFGAHYDPANTSFGRLVACNEEQLAPGAGFAEHPHAALDVVTWVLEGALAHEDSAGGRSVLAPGAVQCLRTGAGVRHSEVNAAPGTTRFAQLWLRSPCPDAPPSYEQHDAGQALLAGEVLPVLELGDGAGLHVGRLTRAAEAALPEAERVHVLVTRGTGEVAGRPVRAGDSVRLLRHRGPALRADPDVEVVVVTQSRE